MDMNARTIRKLQRNLARDKAEALLERLHAARHQSQRHRCRANAQIDAALDKAIASTKLAIERLTRTIEPRDPEPIIEADATPLMPDAKKRAA
ncbi:MAG: hypothetical protein GC162_06690 [Planctomycetes bacterium]|nr:hypothetical protein [Planctomycetota bacterium]